MRLSLIIIFASLLLIPDLYIWYFFLRKKKIGWVLLFFLPLIYTLLVGVLMFLGKNTPLLSRILFYIMLCLSLPKAIFTVGDIISQVIGHWSKKGRKIGLGISVALALVVFSAAVYSCTAGVKKLEVKEQELAFENLPSGFDGYRIVQISDLHIGSYNAGSDYVQRVVDSANALKPDLIVFTGDLVNIKSEEVQPFVEVLSSLKAKDGVISILGNHDYGTYAYYHDSIRSAEECQRLIKIERGLGWNLLIDSNVIIQHGKDYIAVVGVGDIGKPPFKPLGDLKKATASLDSSTFCILLSHDPSHWRMEVLPQTDIPLTLSGHTHAMQFRIGDFSPVKWMYDEWGGLYEENGQKLFVSTGIGGAMPFRLGATPEINLLILKKK
ncbi:MAG: metallophosphoesterase [Bacteroidales bacterium]|nr:metallophosphoesterase [Bacteroidales bacterium]